MARPRLRGLCERGARRCRLAEFESQRSRRDAERRADCGHLARVAAELRNPGLAPVGAEVTATQLAEAQKAVDDARRARAAADAALLQKTAALAGARAALGPEHEDAIDGITCLVRRSFDQAEDVGVGRVTKAARLQWFARHPQARVRPIGDDAIFVDQDSLPAIAAFCGDVLMQTTSGESADP